MARRKIVLTEEQKADAKVMLSQYKNKAEADKLEIMPDYQDSWDYRLAKKPKRQEGQSNNYVEPVVDEAITRVKPSILAISTEGVSPALFRSRGFGHIPHMDDVVNDTIEHIFRKNNIKRVAEDGLDECMTTGSNFAKWFIEDQIQEFTYDAKEPTPVSQVLMQLGSGWKPLLPGSATRKYNPKKKGKWKGMEWKKGKVPVGEEQNPETGEVVTHTAEDIIFIGTLNFEKVTPELIIEHVNLQDLWFDTSCGSDFKKLRYGAHRIEMTVGDAIERGWDQDLIDSAPSSYGLDNEVPLSKRNIMVDYMNPTFVSDSMNEITTFSDPLERNIYVWEHYMYSSIPEHGKKSKLYQWITLDNFEILEVNEIHCMPFVHGQIETISGSFWGRSFHKKFRQMQDMLSSLKRMVIDGAAFSTYGRYIAKKGMYDRQSALNNRPGAVIEVMETGAFDRFPEKGLDQSIVTAIQTMDDTRNRMLSGAAGSITDANGATPELAAATTAMMISNEELKDKVYAKNWAHTFWVPLMEGILATLIAEGYVMIKEDGSTIDARMLVNNQWDFEVDINTANDTAIRNQQLMYVLAQMKQMDPQVVAPSSVVRAGAEYLRNLNFEPEEFLRDPAQDQDPVEVQHQQQLKALELANAKRDLDLKAGQSMIYAAQANTLITQAQEMHKEGESKRQQREDDTLIKFKQAQTGQFKAETAKFEADDNHAVSLFEMTTAAAGNPSNITGIR